MTLFLNTPSRKYEISDAYIMGLSFLIGILLAKVTKRLIEKQIEKQKHAVKMPNPRGGGGIIDLEDSDDTELANVILSCIDDEKNYIVINQKLKEILFNLVKAKLKEESVVLTPNMVRFLALHLSNKKTPILLQFGNLVATTDNQVRLLTRVVGGLLLGALGVAVESLGYAIFAMIIYLNLTADCGFYNCDNYFQEIPSTPGTEISIVGEQMRQQRPLIIHAEKLEGNLAIAGNDQAKQLELYVPSEKQTFSSHRAYQRAKKQPKLVRFSDFKNSDPVLSSFKNLEEPDVPKKCTVREMVRDVIDENLQ